MKLHKKIWAVVTACLLMGSTACEDFLDEQPRSTLSANNTFIDQNSVINGVNGVYDLLGARGTVGSPWGLYAGNLIVLDQLGDVVWSRNGNPRFNSVSRVSFTASYQPFLEVWQLSYIGINRANDFIERAPAVDMDQDRLQGALAEARFIRALHYFNLVRFFGDVPLSLEVIPDINDTYLEASSVQDIYLAIIEDLQFAAENAYYKNGSGLEPEYGTSDIGRITRGAANTLLGKVYLTAASFSRHTTISTAASADAYDWVDAAAYYQLAADHLAVVINSGVYSLLPDYASIFDREVENHAESIFEVQFNDLESDENGLWGGWHSGFNRVSPRNEFADSYNPADLRKAASMEVRSNHWTVTKFWIDPTVTTDKFNSKNNAMVLRYADVLLMYAEAQFEASGVQDYTSLNATRQRAGLTDFAGLTGGQFMDSLLQERKFELCFELHDWHDQVRTGRLLDNVRALRNYAPNNALGTVNPDSPTDAAINIRSINQIFPIPQLELDVNSSLKQNPGY